MPVTKAEKEKREIIKEYRRLLKSYDPGTEEKKNRIRRAFEIAAEAHKEIRRKSGEPYIMHPLAVAQIVVDEIGLGTTSIICALLHDVVEDTEVTLEEIDKEFGPRVTQIIDGLTKISEVFDVNSTAKAENIRKILLTLGKDIRVVLIKLADRLHNMRTMDAMPRHKQLKITSETQYLYIPLAHRLGLYNIKSELEDLCMKYAEPSSYKRIAKKLNETKRGRTRFINEFVKPITKRLDAKGIKYEIIGRPKTIHSIWNKIRIKNVPFEEVYDKFAVRIIIDPENPEQEKADCWRVYSIVTDTYRPNPDRLRDWISTPKGNGYESLHTTVMGPKGRWVEVQIRTRRMNEIAEKGYAAHWKYKDSSEADSIVDKWLESVREVLDNHNSNTYDFLDDVKLDLFAEEIYIFTPKGDIKILPTHATVLDFAYDIHTDIGNRCIGAKVNHKILPPSHILNNGDQVEILTSNKQVPQEAWLGFAVTAKAKSKIKESLRKVRNYNIQMGKAIIEDVLREEKLTVNNNNLEQLAEYFKVSSQNELFLKAATGGLNLKKIKKVKRENDKIQPQKKRLASITPKSIEKEIKETLTRNTNLIIFGENSENIDYQMAPCCKPLPGDDVFGFINVNDKVEIHKSGCIKTNKILSKYDYKIVKTKWTKEKKIAFLTGLILTGLDDVGVMSKITHVISGKLKMNMQSITIDGLDGMFEGKIMVYVNDTDHLEKLINHLKNIDGILSVHRLEE